MNLKTRLVSSAVSLLALPGFSQDKLSDNKQAVIHSVETHQEKLIELSDKIWAFALYLTFRINVARYTYFMSRAAIPSLIAVYPDRESNS